MSDNFAKALSEGFTNGKSVNEEKTFSELFETYSAGMNEDIQVGDKIKGEIISVGMDTVFVNTGTKIDGAVDKAELFDDQGELPYQIGDTVELYVVSMDENEIRLSKAISGVGGLNLLQDAFQNKIPVEGRVKEPCKGGFNVEILQRRAFCPISQMELKYIESPGDYIGKVFQFMITQFEEKGKNIVVSRRELLSIEQEKTRKENLEKFSVGSVLEGKVLNLKPYGAFVELFPGIEGMVHISEISWSRVEHPEEVLKLNDLIKVKVTEIKQGDKPNQLKIALSIKQVTGDPWDTSDEKFNIGDKIKGKVTRCMDFGAFVEIAPGIEGLVHISEMSYKKRVLKAEDIVKPGETIDVMIKDIYSEKRRISLSIKDAEGDPWIGVQERFKPGQAVEGTIEKKEKFGYFISLEPGVTGLLPKSKISKSHQPGLIEKLKEGDTITIIVEEVRQNERRITLGAGDSADEDDWRKYTKGNSAGLGSLGEKLQQALNSKGK
ncbi:MAG: 30S ribosomal protein S1 [Desulfobacteraceae bacterium]|nr:30S ribosomal protein S1 [Desulfobacteraceae bacterium]